MGKGVRGPFGDDPFKIFWQANFFDLINEGLTGPARVKKMVWGYTFVVFAILMIILNSQTDLFSCMFER